MKALLRSLLSRCSSHFRRRRLEAEMAEEMQAHLEVLTEEYVAAGMSPAEARLAARKRFGGVAQLQERCRDEQRFVWLEQVGKDVTFAARSLARARGFTLTVVTMLVLGIGIATVVFNLTSWILLYQQPYPHPEELFLIGFKDKSGTANPYRPALCYQAYREQTDVFAEFAVVAHDVGNVAIDGEPTVVNLVGASLDCFRTLGIRPVLGRGFLPGEYQVGANKVVVITDLFWRQHFGGAADVLGRTLLVDQQPCTVIGVLAVTQPFPPYFQGDVYRPLVLQDAVAPLNPPMPMVFVIGRLKAGIAPEQAGAALRAVKLPTLPLWATTFLADQEPILTGLTDLTRPETYWVMAIAGMLLYAIACLNAMNLMLVRLLGRRRELSIRLALGGTRMQIARMLLLESAGLALLASLIVVVVARWLFGPLLAFITTNEAVRYNSQLNPRTLGCIVALTSLASMVVMLAPVWRLLKSDANPGLKEDNSGGGEGWATRRLRVSLVVLQAAFAVVLLAGTGLMVRSFGRLQRVDLGFESEGRVKVTINFPSGYDLKPEARLQLFERLQQRLAAIPGVRAVSFGQDSLVSGHYSNTQVLMPDGTCFYAAADFVSAEFLQTAGLTMKSGRWLSGKRGDFEVVVNETFAKARFGGEDPVGRSFKITGSGEYALPVVGVVRDLKESVRGTSHPRFYTPIWTYPPNSTSLLLRLDRDPGREFAGLVRHAIYEFDPKLIASQISSIADLIGNSMWAERYAFRMLKMLTFVAVGLVVVGLFSVIAYTVDSRMKEFGVRLALGARPANLHRLVMRRGLTTAGIGVVVGIAGALALTRFMQSLLFETTPYDPLVYAAVAAVLLLAAAAACWLPARRAARVDITKLLRTE